MPADAPAFVARWQQALTTLGSAVPCDSYQAPHPDDDAQLLESLQLSTAAMAASRIALAAGDHAAAVDQWLAAATLARDLLAGPTLMCELVGVFQLDLIAQRWWPPAALAALPDAQLRRLAASLQRLDAAGTPAIQSLRGELWVMARRAEEGLGGGGLLRPFLTAPLVPALRARMDACARLAALGDGDWPAYAAELEQLDRGARSGNRAERLFSQRWQSGAATRRAAVARLRLLRLAVAFQLGDELPQLLDPFANAALGTTATDTGMQLTSVGHDGPILREALHR